MSKQAKRWIIGLILVCAVALVACTVYYIQHPAEADNGIVETMDQLDSE